MTVVLLKIALHQFHSLYFCCTCACVHVKACLGLVYFVLFVFPVAVVVPRLSCHAPQATVPRNHTRNPSGPIGSPPWRGPCSPWPSTNSPQAMYAHNHVLAVTCMNIACCAPRCRFKSCRVNGILRETCFRMPPPHMRTQWGTLVTVSLTNGTTTSTPVTVGEAALVARGFRTDYFWYEGQPGFFQCVQLGNQWKIIQQVSSCFWGLLKVLFCSFVLKVLFCSFPSPLSPHPSPMPMLLPTQGLHRHRRADCHDCRQPPPPGTVPHIPSTYAHCGRPLGGTFPVTHTPSSHAMG